MVRRRVQTRSRSAGLGWGVGVVVGVVAVALVPDDARAAESAESCVAASEAGISARDKGALRDARAHFIECAAESCKNPLRSDCARWLEEVEASVPSIVTGAKNARGEDLFDVTVTVDGEVATEHRSGQPIVLDPGPHVVRFTRTARGIVERREVRVLLRTGERNRPVDVRFGAPEPSPKSRDHQPEGRSPSTLPFILGGVGVLGLGAFTYFGVSGLNEKGQLRDTCGSTCSDDQVAGLRTRYVAADVSLGVGLVALGIATYLLLTGD